MQVDQCIGLLILTRLSLFFLLSLARSQLVLSDLSCDSLNENRLNEFIGVRCRKGRSSYGHTYQTLIDGNWVDINKQVDFNQDGAIQDGQRERESDDDNAHTMTTQTPIALVERLYLSLL